MKTSLQNKSHMSKETSDCVLHTSRYKSQKGSDSLTLTARIHRDVNSVDYCKLVEVSSPGKILPMPSTVTKVTLK